MKKETLRTIFQAVSLAFSNGYVNGFIKGKIYTGALKKICFPGLNCYSCPGAVNACPIGSLQAVLSDKNYIFSLYVFGFIGLIGTVFGRFVCGFVCPFGFIQDLLYKIPLFVKKNSLPGHKILKYTKYIILAVFVLLLPIIGVLTFGSGKPWFCEYICPDGTLFGGIPLLLSDSGLREAIGWRFYLKLAVLIATIVSAVKFYRPFCKYLCPLGALYSLANPISVYRYSFDKSKCTDCKTCVNICKMDVDIRKTPNAAECIRCGKCIEACPTDAIISTAGKINNKYMLNSTSERTYDK